jgi:hypothetical protein
MKNIIKYITYASVLFWGTLASADNVLIIGGEGDSRVAVQNELTAAGHTYTYASTHPGDLTGYQQVWDMRINDAISASEAALYDTFLQNNGYLYLSGENSGFATRNNSISAFVSTLGGGTVTVSGSANNTQTANTTYFPNGETVTYAAAADIDNTGGTGRVLTSDGNGGVTAMMWLGNAGDFGQGYNGTVVVVADINWSQSAFYSANNELFLRQLIAGVAAGTTSGTISDTGTGVGAPTPVYRSAITDIQQAQVDAAYAITAGNNIDLTIIGNSNDVDITQLSNGNYLLMYLEGNSNITDITQSGTNADRNFADINIVGSSNTLNFTQQGDSEKQAMLDIDGSFGTYTITQQGSGEHYLDLTSVGDNATVTVLQEGLGNHAATVELTNSGGNWNFSLTQSGDTNQLYSLPHDLSDNTVVTGTCTTGTCNLTVNQQ